MSDTATPTSLSDYLSDHRAQLARRLDEACATLPWFAQLSAEQRENAMLHMADALIEALAQRDAMALTRAIAQLRASSGAAALLDSDELLRMVRQAAFATSASIIAEQPSVGIAMLDEVAELLTYAVVHEHNQRLRNFHALAEQASSGIMLLNLNGTITYANQALRAMVGYGDDVVGLSGAALLDPNDPAIEEMRRQGPQNGWWRGVLRYRRRDGSCFEGELNGFTIFDEQNVPLAQGSIVNDVSEGLHTDRELRAVTQRLKQAIAASPLATIEWDTQGIVRRWNPSAERIFGWSSEEATGRNVFALLVPEIAAEHVGAVMEALLSGNATNSRNENVRKDGQIITCRWYNAVLRDDEGRVIGCLSQTEDVTAQEQAEQERLALQDQVIAAQQAALRELSTPIIPLAGDMIVMPLVGAVDTSRAQQVLETLLQGVAENHARTAILDITGVQVVDTQVANALIQTAQAVRLLGASTVITGIRPEVAQTLVGLGAELKGIVTRATLQSGIAYAMGGR